MEQTRAQLQAEKMVNMLFLSYLDWIHWGNLKLLI
jgi:hypothetical protein